MVVEPEPDAGLAIIQKGNASGCIGSHVRLPGRGNANSQSARPVHPIVTMIKWIRTSRLSVKNSLCIGSHVAEQWQGWRGRVADRVAVEQSQMLAW